jgi:hypothetical protein
MGGITRVTYIRSKQVAGTDLLGGDSSSDSFRCSDVPMFRCCHKSPPHVPTLIWAVHLLLSHPPVLIPINVLAVTITMEVPIALYRQKITVKTAVTRAKSCLSHFQLLFHPTQIPSEDVQRGLYGEPRLLYRCFDRFHRGIP